MRWAAAALCNLSMQGSQMSQAIVANGGLETMAVAVQQRRHAASTQTLLAALANLVAHDYADVAMRQGHCIDAAMVRTHAAVNVLVAV